MEKGKCTQGTKTHRNFVWLKPNSKVYWPIEKMKEYTPDI